MSCSCSTQRSSRIPLSGRAAVLVGPSGMGKTTLAAELGRRWAYVTDECAAIDRGGAVHRFPKPLAVGASGGLKRLVSPTEAGLVPPPASIELDAVWLLDRTGTSDVELADLAPARAVAMLAEHTSYLAALERPLHRLADVVERSGGAQVLRYQEAADVDALLAARWRS